ncbi:CBM96 family carbohydrate-binding protein [Dyadobacter flavalbus]|nr:malectin domain-containing carbohydrate-binding protein [Dyadobacter flavalbus]
MTNDRVGRRKWLASLLAGLLFFTLCGIWPGAAAAPVLAHIGKRTVIVGHTVVFDADAITNVSLRRTYSLVNAPAGTYIDPRGGSFRWTPQTPGVFTFGVKVTEDSPEALSDEKQVTINVLDIYANDTIRINAGGKDYITADGRKFKADAYFTATNPRTSAIKNGDILNTTDDELYRSGRSSPEFAYRMPVPDGEYNVVLHFAEIWFGAPGGRKGQRRFNVYINNVRKLDEFDITAHAGGAMTATQVTIPVTITSGVINIRFYLGSADIPRLAALEVLMTNRITKVSLPAIADSYVRSDHYADTNYGSADSLFVKSGKNKARAYIKFSLAGLGQVTSAKLRIYGSCNCLYSSGLIVRGINDDRWTENEITWNNAPTDVTGYSSHTVVTDNPKYHDLDVTEFIQQQINGDGIATLLLEWIARDTRSNYNSRENSLNPPQLLIYTDSPVNSNMRINQESESAVSFLEAKQEKSVIYPNPVQRQFSITFSEKHTGNISLNIINQQGRSIHVGIVEKSIAASKAEIDISNLAISKGVHMLQIQSETKTEVVKLLIAE